MASTAGSDRHASRPMSGQASAPASSAAALIARPASVSVPLCFSQMAQVDNLVTIGKTGCRNQSQQTKQKARNKPHAAVASLLTGNRRSKESADQM